MSASRDHYSLRALRRRPGCRTLRRAALRRADRPVSARHAAVAARRRARTDRRQARARRRHRHRPRRARARRRRRPRHRPRLLRARCCASRARGPSRGTGARRVRPCRRARAADCGSARWTRRSACACSCTRSTGDSASPSSAASRAGGWSSTFRRRRASPRSRAPPAACAARSAGRSRRIASSAPARCAPPLPRTAFAIVRTHRQFVLPIALHKAIGRLGVTRAVEGALRGGRACCALFGSPVTMVFERER